MKKEEFSLTSQRMVILKHLKKKPISTWEAIDLYGFTRLSAIIFDLRDMGFDVQDKWVYGVNRYGHNIKWKEYFLVEKEPKKENNKRSIKWLSKIKIFQ